MLGTLIVMSAAAAIVGSAYARHQARQRAVKDSFRSFGTEPTRHFVNDWGGCIRGVDLRYSFYADRSRRQTICRALLHDDAPRLEMQLRPQTRMEVRDVEHGRAIDLVLGDEAFDDSFIVEAAPSDLARELLDERARTALLTFHPCRLTIEGRELRFVKGAYLDEPAEIRRVLELCSELGSRLPTLPATLEARRLAEHRVAEPYGYRDPPPDALRGADRRSQEAAELATLHEVQHRRTINRVLRGLAITGVFLIAWVLMVGARCR